MTAEIYYLNKAADPLYEKRLTVKLMKGFCNPLAGWRWGSFQWFATVHVYSYLFIYQGIGIRRLFLVQISTWCHKLYITALILRQLTSWKKYTKYSNQVCHYSLFLSPPQLLHGAMHALQLDQWTFCAANWQIFANFWEHLCLCAVGSYVSLSVCPSVCPSVTRPKFRLDNMSLDWISDWTICHQTRYVWCTTGRHAIWHDITKFTHYMMVLWQLPIAILEWSQ